MGTTTSHNLPPQLNPGRPPVTIEQKLIALVDCYGLTNEQIASAAGCSSRSIEMRRHRARAPQGKSETRASRYDSRIDELHGLMWLLVERSHVELPLARAFVFGLSPYLEEQAPSTLLAGGEFELVREAALAFSAATHPEDFVALHKPIPRPVGDPPTKRKLVAV